jgi:hypothetical protein
MSTSKAQQDGYQANTNQARDEPMPASHDEEHGQDAVVRNEEHAAGARGDRGPAQRKTSGRAREDRP